MLPTCLSPLTPNACELRAQVGCRLMNDDAVPDHNAARDWLSAYQTDPTCEPLSTSQDSERSAPTGFKSTQVEEVPLQRLAWFCPSIVALPTCCPPLTPCARDSVAPAGCRFVTVHCPSAIDAHDATAPPKTHIRKSSMVGDYPNPLGHARRYAAGDPILPINSLLFDGEQVFFWAGSIGARHGHRGHIGVGVRSGRRDQ